MTPEKRKKIKALMDSPASAANEKEICRKLLADNPETEPVNKDPRFSVNWDLGQAPRSQESGDFWSRAFQSGAAWEQQQREKSFSQQNFDEYRERQHKAQAEENTRRQDGRARRGGPEFFKADCDDCRRPFTTWVDGPRRCRTCKAQGSGQQHHSTLGDRFRDAQRETNKFYSALADLLTDDTKKKGDK